MSYFRFVSKRILALAVVASLSLLGMTSRSEAAQVNTSATLCAQSLVPAAQANDIEVGLAGVINKNPTLAKTVVCSAPWSPVSLANVGVTVIGQNPVGASTNCTVIATNFDGDILRSKSFLSSLPKFQQFVSFGVNEFSTSGFVSVFCSLPPGGILSGFLVNQ